MIRVIQALLFAYASSVAFCAKKEKATAGGSKACSHTGFYSKKIVPLCEKHFPDDSSKNIWIVQFYHPYVKKVAETREAFEEFAKDEKGLAGGKVGAVDCAQNGEFCAKHGIQEAPTSRAILHGHSRDLHGEHTVEALQAFLEESVAKLKEMQEATKCDVKGLFTDPMKDSALPLCTANFPPSLEQVPWLISFYEQGDVNKDKTMRSTMNKLAEKYGNTPPKKVDAKKKTLRLRVGAVECTRQEAGCADLGISQVPTVRFYRAGAEPVSFDSFFDSGELKQFADARLKEMPKIEVKRLEADMPEDKSAEKANAEL